MFRTPAGCMRFVETRRSCGIRLLDEEERSPGAVTKADCVLFVSPLGSLLSDLL